MLDDEITSAQRLVKTDGYEMSIGELVNMYREEDLIINPDFQRLFRWNSSQKSKFIESILLGIPIPSIFTFEGDDGKWELIDGLQRVSTILEFMGLLKDPTNQQVKPSALEATTYLPSLHNVVWERSDALTDPRPDQQVELSRPQQLAVRRAKIGVKILKPPSSAETKYDLFQRLNAGGTQANPQEVRNCIVIMINKDYFESLKALSSKDTFQEIISLNEEQIERQRHIEWATRFLVYNYVPYDGNLDIEEYMDKGIASLAKAGRQTEPEERFVETFALLQRYGKDALRRFEAGKHIGRVGLVAFECIAVGIAKNLPHIRALPNPDDFISRKIRAFWESKELEGFLSPGVRGTTRIQKTIPFGEAWFRP
jgi:hypothetical protein